MADSRNNPPPAPPSATVRTSIGHSRTDSAAALDNARAIPVWTPPAQQPLPNGETPSAVDAGAMRRRSRRNNHVVSDRVLLNRLIQLHIDRQRLLRGEV